MNRTGYFPIDPLIQITEDLYGPLSNKEVAEQCGVQVSTFHKWKQKGFLGTIAADRAAISLGYHPTIIWEEWEQA